MDFFRTAVLLSTVIFFAGCRRSESPAAPPIVRVVVRMPGAPPRDLDALVSSAFQPALHMVYGVDATMCLSWEEDAEIFIRGKPGIAAAEFADAIKARLEEVKTRLPPDTTVQWAGPVAEFPDVSTLPIRQVPCIQAKVNREKAGWLGVSENAVHQAVRSHKGESMESLGKVMLVGAGGREVPLREVADLSMGEEPNCVVRQSPSTGGPR